MDFANPQNCFEWRGNHDLSNKRQPSVEENKQVWPNVFLMNVFFTLKGSRLLLLFQNGYDGDDAISGLR